MSKTFASIQNVIQRKLEVTDYRGGPNLVITGHCEKLGISVATTDAPALALAVLEAAGVKACAKEFGATAGTMAQLEDIAWALADYSNAKALEAEQAADREALDAEALELYNKVMRSGKDPLSEWLPTLQFTRIKYTNIAKAARELHGATK